jgi:putative ABC transport system substrate-binding protein
LKAAETTARALGLRLHSAPVRNATDLDSVFSTMARERVGAALVLSTPLFIGSAGRLAELAIAHKLPTMFGPTEHAEAGGLLSYGPDRNDLYRRAASYVDKILKGAKPADLPVEQATKLDLVVNLRTARRIGVAIPPSVLARASQIIE